MNGEKENSVMRALCDLGRMESDRVNEERVRAEREQEERRQREAARRREAEAARELEARAERELEMRQRLEEEMRQKDDEARIRILSLKAELDAVQADREAMRHAMRSRYENLPLEPAPVRTVPLNRVVAGGVVLMAAVVGAFLLVPGNRKSDVEYGMSTDTWTPETPESATLPSAVEPTDEAPKSPMPITVEKIEPEAVKPVVKPRKVGRNGNRRPKPPKPRPQDKNINILDNFDKCGNDPMCGGLFPDSREKDKKKRNAKKPRR